MVNNYGDLGEPFRIFSGTPQGGVSSPIIFNIAVASIHKEVEDEYNIDIPSYADDDSGASMIKNQADVQNLEAAMNKLATMLKNRLNLNLNADKSCAMFIPTTRKQSDIDLAIKLSGTVLKMVNSHLHLGVMFDDQLSFGLHVSKKIAQKVGYIESVINKLTKAAPQSSVDAQQEINETRIHLCKTLFLSNASYAMGSWRPKAVSDKRKLERLHKRFFNAQSNLTSSYKEKLKVYRVWPLVARIDLETCMLVMNDYLKNKNVSRFHLPNARGISRGSRKLRVVLPSCRNKTMHHLPSIQGPLLTNEFLQASKQEDNDEIINKTISKAKLRTLLFNWFWAKFLRGPKGRRIRDNNNNNNNKPQPTHGYRDCKGLFTCYAYGDNYFLKSNDGNILLECHSGTASSEAGSDRTNHSEVANIKMDEDPKLTIPHALMETVVSKIEISNAQPKSSTLSSFLPGVVAAGEQRVPAEQPLLSATVINKEVASASGSGTTATPSNSSSFPTFLLSSSRCESVDRESSLLSSNALIRSNDGGAMHASKRDWTSAFTDDDDDKSFVLREDDGMSSQIGRTDQIRQPRATGRDTDVNDDSLSAKLLPCDVPLISSSSSRFSVFERSLSPPPATDADADRVDSLSASETVTAAADEDDFAIQQNELEMAMSDVPSDSMPEEKMKLSLLLANLSEDQLERYEVFRRSCFSRNNVKRIMQTITGTAVTQNIVIALCGMTKVFVGEVIEEALDVQTEWKQEGTALEPKHIREAVRRLQPDFS